MDGCVHACMHGMMDGRTDERTDGCMDVCMYVSSNVHKAYGSTTIPVATHTCTVVDHDSGPKTLQFGSGLAGLLNSAILLQRQTRDFNVGAL